MGGGGPRASTCATRGAPPRAARGTSKYYALYKMLYTLWGGQVAALPLFKVLRFDVVARFQRNYVEILAGCWKSEGNSRKPAT